jgi:hypothetical protein
MLAALANLAGFPLQPKASPKEMKKALDDAVSWLRNNNPFPSAQQLAKFLGSGVTHGFSPREKEELVDNVVDWARNNNDPTLQDLDGPICSLLLLGISSHSKTFQQGENAGITLEDTVNWLRNNEPDPRGVDDPNTARWALTESLILLQSIGSSHHQKRKRFGSVMLFFVQRDMLSVPQWPMPARSGMANNTLHSETRSEHQRPRELHHSQLCP